jgi:hypothetical protein
MVLSFAAIWRSGRGGERSPRIALLVDNVLPIALSLGPFGALGKGEKPDSTHQQWHARPRGLGALKAWCGTMREVVIVILAGFLIGIMVVALLVHFLPWDGSMTARFPPPWSIEEQDACFVVRDHDGQQLAYILFRGWAGRRSAAKLLTRGRRIAVNIAKLPELLRKP